MGRHSVRRDPGAVWQRRLLASMLVVVVVLAIVLAAMLMSRGAVEPARQVDGFAEPASHAAAGAGASAGSAMSPAIREARASVEELVAPYGDAVAVSVAPVGAGTGFSINGDESFVSASMIKLAVLAEYLRAVDSGELDPHANYELRASPT